MTATQATVEVFWTVFKGLPPAERQAVLRRLVQDKYLRHALMDWAVIESRRAEPSRPLRAYLKEARQRK
jgi:hypothetical protein